MLWCEGAVPGSLVSFMGYDMKAKQVTGPPLNLWCDDEGWAYASAAVTVGGPPTCGLLVQRSSHSVLVLAGTALIQLTPDKIFISAYAPDGERVFRICMVTS